MKFQFTLPHGERRHQVLFALRPGAVSIHAPAWGATAARPGLSAAARVSIHAPAWGATPALGHRRRWRHVSIHAPAWGATLATFAIAIAR